MYAQTTVFSSGAPGIKSSTEPPTRSEGNMMTPPTSIDSTVVSGVTTSSTKGSPPVGRGGGRGRYGRGRGGRGGAPRPNNPTKFKGTTKEMHGHVFQCFNESDASNQFTRSVEALGEYIAKTMKNSGDLTSLTKDLILPMIPEPGKPSSEPGKPSSEPGEPSSDSTSEFRKEVWRTRVKSYVSRYEILESNLKAVYAVVWGQCSTTMRTKVF
jgi:hypothetical protein